MKKITKELGPVYLCIAAIILMVLLTGFGLIHLLCKTIYHTFQVKFWKGPIYFLTQMFKILYQIWSCIKYLSLEVAISIDLFGNVICGEAIEDLVTSEEKTLFGSGDVTISTSIGELETKDKLNKTGIKFSKFLSKVLDKNHCVESYNRYLYNKKFKVE